MTVAFTTPAEFRDRAAAWERRAKEATSAENHKMMLYAAAGCRERADEDEAEVKQHRSVIRLDDKRGGPGPRRSP
jgi:hypothetical protein